MYKAFNRDAIIIISEACRNLLTADHNVNKCRSVMHYFKRRQQYNASIYARPWYATAAPPSGQAGNCINSRCPANGELKSTDVIVPSRCGLLRHCVTSPQAFCSANRMGQDMCCMLGDKNWTKAQVAEIPPESAKGGLGVDQEWEKMWN